MPLVFVFFCSLFFFTSLANSLVVTSFTTSSLQIYDGQEGFGEGVPWLEWTDGEQWALLYAQNFTLVIWVWYMIWMSSTFMSRTLSLRAFMPWKNRVWIGSCAASMLLQIVFCIISVFRGPNSVQSVPWWIYIIAFFWPVVFMPVQEIVKARDMKECVRAQKLAKLEFNTKLGMHSPL
ncbi:hypothetical protein BCR41DRAFT_378656 [Lobosporangium transversale]|uniref:Uncharacterized protein n=1 Tax=Lobosporangium transversale TaxID=64571 RepID=A0A1Y2GI51_9FUNG|nr:hypothetical protein BCR41DRAFT_378656 [Lobosporangium transversale]ORZ08076.1 hypothetical protein BCR41DRAFT_378656 [Lobosporangium transversale]|eukprot:XP_021878310.1 hypothetical protein BCR41DRAFT_378656 [Lobosporangium transversale]